MMLENWFTIFKLPLVVYFNEVVPEAAGYVNDVLTKKT
jgi:hypothetical protein